MKNSNLIIALLCAVIVSACAPKSSRPVATGKGNIRMLHASVTAPDVLFLLEERRLDSVGYKAITTANAFDDLEYNVNFDYRFVGDVDATRLLITPFKMNANNDHLFVFTGSLSAPSSLLWERPLRTWDGSETVFEVEFGHLSPQVGEVDIYFAAPGVAPQQGAALTTLTNGNKSGITELDSGDYVVTVTTKDDPTDILYESGVLAYGPSVTLMVAILDGDPSIPSPFSVNVLTEGGTSRELENVLAPQTLRVFHAAIDTVAFDLYRDGDFSAPLIANVAYGAASQPTATVAASSDYSFTEVDNVGNILLEENFGLPTGRRTTRFLIGQQPNISTASTVDDLRSREDIGRVRFFHGSFNQSILDIYVVSPGTDINETFPTFFGQLVSTVAGYLNVAPGSYEIYVTEPGSKTVFVGPVTLDIGVGGVVQYAIIDTVDPVVLDLVKYDDVSPTP